ncbi:MAG: DUF2330 domain-containing protein [Nannocystaceae bacterium]
MLRRAAARLARSARIASAPLVLALAVGGVAFAAPAVADAFCGFYVSGADAKLFNNATMVVMMREGTRTVLSMQNNYQGPPQDFAMVIPVPVILQEENVKTLTDEVFTHVDQLAAPRLVEYWEQDPCNPQPMPTMMPRTASRAKSKKSSGSAEAEDLGVTVEAEFAVGEYNIVILSAKDSGGLDTWLRQEKYNIPAGAEPLLRPYVEEGMKFFVAKVNTKKVKFDGKGQAKLSPLRFHYDSPEFRLPVRLGLINSAGTQDLLVHILAKGKRYELANMPNVTIPTNLDVAEGAKDRFGELYAALFDATLAHNKGAAVTEYSWDSGSCDPCPTPPLDYNDLATLGADVLGDAEADALSGKASKSGRRIQRGAWGFVLTRLHLRYDKDNLGEDLIFREANAIVGGREFMMGDKLEKGARENYVNNFQARYAIRHPWTGPVACQNPQRGIWGAPPDGREPKPKAAKDLAFAARGGIQLAKMIQEPVPELGMMTADIQPPSGKVEGLEPPPVGDSQGADANAGDSRAGGDAEASAPPPAATPGSDKGSASDVVRSKGCQCGVDDDPGAPLGAVLGLFGLVGLRRRRR